jgi:glycosyltransferase involved in cell wall biosynthesis
VNLLGVAKPAEFGIEKVIVWGPKTLLERLPARPWLDARHEPALDAALPSRLHWQAFRLQKLAEEHCHLLFVPGGNSQLRFSPLVTMSRNMLPFEYGELFRYGISPTTLRLLLLRFGQKRTFRRADGVTFLTEYARSSVTQTAALECEAAVIPHGVDDAFRRPPRRQRSTDECALEDPLRLLYVSVIDLYKHQVPVAEAVARLRSSGLPVRIDFVGPAYAPALKRFRATLDRLDPHAEFLRYCGPVPHAELAKRYHGAEVFVFASSCENMPNILLEAMAAGLPVACSNRGPMPEVLGRGGELFDPESAESIADTLLRLARDRELRQRCAEAAHRRAGDFSWTRCAHETLAFLAATHAKIQKDR